MDRIEPVLKPVSISKLLPTQITVGRREVTERRRRWQEKDSTKERAYLGSHMVPVILGPKNRHYIIDHHHLALALHEEGVKKMLVSVVADLTKLNTESFWFTMDTRGWLHPFDDKGRRRTYKDLPKAVSGLIDDPFRSLAGELRRVGGFSKETTPFSEFLWADFLRHRIKRKNIEKSFSHALEEALLLAKSSDADYLPGWCGPTGI
ncbi:MAG: ParB-like protein [Rhizomicrobium sp.]